MVVKLLCAAHPLRVRIPHQIPIAKKEKPHLKGVVFFLAFMNLMYIFQQFIDDIKTKRV